MRMSCRIAALNPMIETTNPARLIQSPTCIFIGSPAVILEKGRATFTWFLGATTLGAERDLGVRAVPLSLAISQPPVIPGGQCSMCVRMPSGYHLPVRDRRHSQSRETEPDFTCRQIPMVERFRSLPILLIAHSSSPGAHRVVLRSDADPDWNDPRSGG